MRVYRQTGKRVAASLLKPCLPTDCDLHCITHRCIIGCHDDLPPVEMECGGNVAGILIPKYAGVEIRHVNLKYWESGRPIEGPVKCLLIMAETSEATVQEFIQDCVDGQKEKFALGGGYMSTNSSAFVFSGDNVDAASIVLDSTTEKKAIESELKAFQKTGLLENECFCFIFNCVGRDKGFFKEESYQTKVFRKIYPKVPLVGWYAEGEYGVYHLPNVDQEEAWYKRRAEQFGFRDLYRGYTTVFVLVSIKKPNK